MQSVFAGRFYTSDHGRWLNRDPIGVNGGINIYNSVSNNMVNGFSGGMSFFGGMSINTGVVGRSSFVDSYGEYVHPNGIYDPKQVMSDIGPLEKPLWQNAANEALNAKIDDPQFKGWNPHTIVPFIYHKYTETFYEKIRAKYSTDVVNGSTPGNKWVFTCKYGWVDLGHFFTAGYYARIVGANKSYQGSIGVEILQDINLRIFKDMYKATAQSAWTYEDLNSNHEGAYRLFNKNVGQITNTVKKFFIEAGAITNLNLKVKCDGKTCPIRELLEDMVNEVLNKDKTKYIGDREKGKTANSALQYQRSFKQFKCLCNGNRPKDSKYTYGGN